MVIYVHLFYLEVLAKIFLSILLLICYIIIFQDENCNYLRGGGGGAPRLVSS